MGYPEDTSAFISMYGKEFWEEKSWGYKWGLFLTASLLAKLNNQMEVICHEGSYVEDTS